MTEKEITNESTERERNEVFIESQVVREKTFDKTMDRFKVEYKEDIDKFNSQLSQIEINKANKLDVISTLSETRKKSDSIEMSDLSTAVKEAIINGGSNIPIVGEDSIGYENLKYGEVKYRALYPQIRKMVLESNKYEFKTSNIIAETNNGSNFNQNDNTITIPSGQTGNNTVLRYNTNCNLTTNDTVTVIVGIKRSKSLGGIGVHCKATRNNALINLSQLDSQAHFLNTTNDIIYISTFEGKSGDLNITPTILYSNSNIHSEDVTIQINYFYAGVSMQNELSEKINILNENICLLKNETISEIEKLESNLFDKEIYHDFDNTLNQQVTVFNGATKIDVDKFMIPSGQMGAESYIGADFYISDKTSKKIILYAVINVSEVDIHKPTDFKITKFIPNDNGFTEVTTETNYKRVNDNVYVLFAEHDISGEDYVKVRVQLRASKFAKKDTTVFISGFLYSILKTGGTINKALNDSIVKIVDEKIANIKTPDNSKNERILIFDGVNSKFNEVTKATGGSDVFVEITQNYNTTLRVFGIKDNSKFLLPLTNVNTGTTSKEAVYCSKYKVHVDDYDVIIIERYSSSSDFGSMIVYLSNYCNNTPIRDTRKYNVLAKDKINNVVKLCDGISTYGVRHGKLLGSRISDGIVEILESDSTYASFVKKGTLPNATDNPSHVEICGDNSVVIISKTGQVFRTEDLVNYVQVLDIKDHIYAWGGFTQLDAVNNIVLVSEYRLPMYHQTSWTEKDGGKLYLSDDFGKTFKVIFDLPVNDPRGSSTTNTHIHAIKYDPYEDIIWIVTGDGIGSQMIWYSLDKGDNWYQSTSFVQNAIQMTSIYPLKNCVLFGSDGRLVGVARYNRPECGTMRGVKMHFDYPMILAEGWGKSGGTNVPVASRGAIDYKNSKVYFGFLGAPYIHAENTYDVLKNGEIWASDGYITELVFRNETEIDYGVIAVYEDFENNRAIGKLGREGKFVEINTEIWDK